MVINKLYNKMTYKEDMWFQRRLSLWDCQGSGVSACYEFKHSMAPNSPWISSCANGNQIMTHQVKPATTTLSSRKSCMEESTLIHWNLSWVACLVIPLASCFNFAQVMASWESIFFFFFFFSRNEVIIASVVSWKQLSTSSRSVLCTLQRETCWGKFPRSLILRSFLIPRKALER